MKTTKPILTKEEIKKRVENALDYRLSPPTQREREIDMLVSMARHFTPTQKPSSKTLAERALRLYHEGYIDDYNGEWKHI